MLRVEGDGHVGGLTREAAFTIVVAGADGDGVRAGIHQLAWDGVRTGDRPVGCGAYVRAVPIGDVFVVDGSEGERKVLARPVGRDVDGAGEPDDAVEVAQPRLELTGQLDVGGVGIRRREDAHSLVGGGNGSLPDGTVAVVEGADALIGIAYGSEVGHLLLVAGDIGKPFGRGPRLGGGAAPRAVDDADGHLQLLP